MKWKDIQQKLIAKKDKEICLNFAIACAEKAETLTDSTLVKSALSELKVNRWKYAHDRFQPLAKERISHKDDLVKKEAAHVLIHATELPSVNSIQSMAGHAARCGEALSRINEEYCIEVMNKFGI